MPRMCSSQSRQRDNVSSQADHAHSQSRRRVSKSLCQFTSSRVSHVHQRGGNSALCDERLRKCDRHTDSHELLTPRPHQIQMFFCRGDFVDSVNSVLGWEQPNRDSFKRHVKYCNKQKHECQEADADVCRRRVLFANEVHFHIASFCNPLFVGVYPVLCFIGIDRLAECLTVRGHVSHHLNAMDHLSGRALLGRHTPSLTLVSIREAGELHAGLLRQDSAQRVGPQWSTVIAQFRLEDGPDLPERRPWRRDDHSHGRACHIQHRDVFESQTQSAWGRGAQRRIHRQSDGICVLEHRIIRILQRQSQQNYPGRVHLCQEGCKIGERCGRRWASDGPLPLLLDCILVIFVGHRSGIRPANGTPGSSPRCWAGAES
mmetsp:Transcript_159623/g.291235  ORF Transcript_159623/g.291235 Transcript_159623/m.291235 type:complete len:373 (+) Transcript_159623:3453-4571(+)